MTDTSRPHQQPAVDMQYLQSPPRSQQVESMKDNPTWEQHHGTVRGDHESSANIDPPIPFETRQVVHLYGFRRPRLLHYVYQSNLVTAAEDDIPTVQRERLSIFIDLLWVGIISNISEVFSVKAFDPEESYGIALLEFIILFLTAFHIWNYLRDFLNSFFLDDLLQRLLIIWILLLALLFGNNVDYFLEDEGGTAFIIGIFLISRATFFIVEGVYTYFIPMLRNQLLLNFLGSLPIMALYIAGIFVSWPGSSPLFSIATLAELVRLSITNSPLGDRFIGNHYKKAPDYESYQERLASFFIIILGEGVFLLIKNNPLGRAFSPIAGNGVLVLMIYYLLSCLYFSGDQSQCFVHALRRSWWAATFWSTSHVILYAAVLIFDASILVLITQTQSGSDGAEGGEGGEGSGGSPLTEEEYLHVLRFSKWTAAVSLGVTLASMTIMALLNKSCDKPGTLVINNRYARLAPRMAFIVITICLGVPQQFSARAFVSVSASLLFLVVAWEWFAGLEKGAKWLEPKNEDN